MTKRIFSDMRRKHDRMQMYCTNAMQEIKTANLRILRTLSVAGCITILLFSLITMVVLPGWLPSGYHYAFLGLMVLFVLVSSYMNKVPPKKIWIEKLACGSFVGMLMIFICILDTVPAPQTSQIFVSLFLVVAPILFIAPFEEVVIAQVGSLLLFTLMTYYIKDVDIASTDFLAAILGFAMSFVIYGIVMNVRIEEYMEKNLYKISSETDPLTKIDNRTICKKKIDHMLMNKSEREACAMLVLDVDNFKTINDTLGHNKGDEVLIALAEILTDVFRKTDVVGRFGGDEFLIFLKDFDDINFIKRKCSTIETRMKYILEGRFDITCSIGVCVLEEGTASMEKMFKVADDALYAAKTFHKGEYLIREYSNKQIKEELPLMLIVDDNLVDREVIAVQFEEDYHIEKFENGTTALQYIEEHAKKISIILLDMFMPDINGSDVLKILRSKKETSRIPVVVISSDEMTEEEALTHGADDMIAKPIVPAITKLRVENALKRVHR